MPELREHVQGAAMAVEKAFAGVFRRMYVETGGLISSANGTVSVSTLLISFSSWFWCSRLN